MQIIVKKLILKYLLLELHFHLSLTTVQIVAFYFQKEEFHNDFDFWLILILLIQIILLIDYEARYVGCIFLITQNVCSHIFLTPMFRLLILD